MVLFGKYEGRRPPEILTVDWRIVLIWIVTKQDVRLCPEFIWPRILTTNGPL
jgi:hypothetical protein